MSIKTVKAPDQVCCGGLHVVFTKIISSQNLSCIVYTVFQYAYCLDLFWALEGKLFDFVVVDLLFDLLQ